MTPEEPTVEGDTTENATPEKIDLVDETTNEVMQLDNPDKALVTPPLKEASQPFDLSAVTNKATEDAYFQSLIIQMDNKKEELMKPVEIRNISSIVWKHLDKESVRKHLEIWISIHLQKAESICIENPILIKVNQDTAKEIETAIAAATTSDEANELKKSRAAAMQKIQNLKDDMDIDNVGTVLEQQKEIIKQLQNYIA